MALVFMEFWQHECCGQPFAVGDAVTWPVVPVTSDGLQRMLGDDLGRQLGWAVERHDDKIQQVSGTVAEIHAVHYRLEHVEEHPDGPHARAEAGSGVLQAVERADRRETLDDLEWAGYIIDLHEENLSAS